MVLLFIYYLTYYKHKPVIAKLYCFVQENEFLRDATSIKILIHVHASHIQT